jgi:phosphatidylglycerol:prolipoprotein diacylglycerol transferase
VHPILFSVLGYPVSSYGLALAVSFALGIWLAYRRALRHGIDPELVLELGIAVLVSSLVGSRLLWVVTHREVFRAPNGTLRDALGFAGLSMQGGIVLAIVVGVAWILFRRAPLLRTIEVVLPSVALGEGITRIGCFLNGCCHGVVCDLPWAVRFPVFSIPHGVLGDVLLHPTQIYASVGGFLLFGLLSVWLARAPVPGAVMAGWLFGTGVLRLVVDAFRYYEPSVTLFMIGDFAFTVNTPVSLGMLVAGLATWIVLARRAPG